MDIVDEFGKYFQSGNDVPVDRATIKRSEWQAVVDEITTLRQKLDEAGKDQERLDWVDNVSQEYFLLRIVKSGNARFIQGVNSRVDAVLNTEPFSNIRDGIDAAIEAGRSEG